MVTRYGIAFSMNELPQACSKPLKPHLAALKRVLRYLKGCRNLGITYKKEFLHIEEYSDKPTTANPDTMRSTMITCKPWVCSTDSDGSVDSEGRIHCIQLRRTRGCLSLEFIVRAVVQGPEPFHWGQLGQNRCVHWLKTANLAQAQSTLLYVLNR